MSQQGGTPTGHEDDWWGQLYDDSTEDTGPTRTADSLDDRFASAAGAVRSAGAAESAGAAAPRQPESGAEPADAPGVTGSVPAPRAEGSAPRGRTDWWTSPPTTTAGTQSSPQVTVPSPRTWDTTGSTPGRDAARGPGRAAGSDGEGGLRRDAGRRPESDAGPGDDPRDGRTAGRGGEREVGVDAVRGAASGTGRGPGPDDGVGGDAPDASGAGAGSSAGAVEADRDVRPSGRHRAPWEPPPATPAGPTGFPPGPLPPGFTERPPGAPAPAVGDGSTPSDPPPGATAPAPADGLMPPDRTPPGAPAPVLGGDRMSPHTPPGVAAPAPADGLMPPDRTPPGEPAPGGDRTSPDHTPRASEPSVPPEPPAPPTSSPSVLPPPPPAPPMPPLPAHAPSPPTAPTTSVDGAAASFPATDPAQRSAREPVTDPGPVQDRTPASEHAPVPPGTSAPVPGSPPEHPPTVVGVSALPLLSGLPPLPVSKDYVGSGPPTYDAEPTALPPADPDDLDDLVADTVLDGARYGTFALRAASVRGDSARYRGEPRRDSLLTARFGTGEHALILVAMATGARATPGAHRAAAEVCQWIARAVGRSHVRLAEDIRAARRGDLKSGLHRLTDRSLGRLRAGAAEQGLEPDEYAATLRCLLLPADPACRTRVFFGVGAGGLFRLRGGVWRDIEPQVGEVAGEPVLGFGSLPAETPEGDRLTMDLGITTPPNPYDPDPGPPREPFRFRASVARPGDTLLMCTGGLAEPLRGEPDLSAFLAKRWSDPAPPGLAAFLADTQVRVKGYADDRTAAAVWEA
ncbi:protein phosphatase 2C domain-containing protein [Streptomyces sp. NPDC017435]|uniref:PP2C family serine/threonine-protein phosphatase n=1 Tax=Streptomyces sp. NPDC017435 TaxID=3364995 RepID=UPI00379FC4C0